MDCWIVIGLANYKILPPDPIALPPSSAFSTPLRIWLARAQMRRCCAQPLIDPPRERS
jgi:hypothetical protein